MLFCRNHLAGEKGRTGYSRQVNAMLQYLDRRERKCGLRERDCQFLMHGDVNGFSDWTLKQISAASIAYSTLVT